MEFDSYYDTARDGLLNIFYVQLLLENYDEARQVCLSGHDLWKNDYKFFECQLTLMLYDVSTPRSTRSARWLVEQADRLDTPGKARAVGNEYRVLFRDVVVGIVAARNGDSTTARGTLARVREQVARSGSATLRYDFNPQEAMLVWELGDHVSARTILVDWLKHRPDEVPNFRRDPSFRRMRLRDEVLRQAQLPLTSEPSCVRPPS